MSDVVRWVVGEWGNPKGGIIWPMWDAEHLATLDWNAEFFFGVNTLPLTQLGAEECPPECGRCGGFIPAAAPGHCSGKLCDKAMWQWDVRRFCPQCYTGPVQKCVKCEYYEESLKTYLPEDIPFKSFEELLDRSVPQNEPVQFQKIWDTEPSKDEINDFITTYMDDHATRAVIAEIKGSEVQIITVYDPNNNFWTNYLNKNRFSLGLGRRKKNNFGKHGQGFRNFPPDIQDIIHEMTEKRFSLFIQ